IFYLYFYQKKISEKRKNFILKFVIHYKLNPLQILLLISLSIISFLMIYNANSNSIVSMLFRGGEFKELIQMSTTSGLIIHRVFQPLAMMCLLYYISSKTKNILVYFILILLALITCSPLGMARFSAAAMYIPLFLLIIPILRKKNVFSIVFILGLLLVFPFLNNFRNFTGNEINFGFNFGMFSEGHFDSYQNFALVVSENIVTWGRQLVGVILFWIPRSIWADKPIGSGGFIAEDQGFTFSNVSCNYFAEGYINFGYVGILIFIIALSYITAKLDKMYWTISVYSKNNYFNVIYYVLIGMLFFVLRGDLMSSFAYTIGFLFSIWLVYKVAGVKIKRM
ncbi:MAG TPA: oligosaccharide repeat unit polymerase, partial [Gallicola sp.]|nr:oligosaccharide repeat unit polymerase [Gallicola sp.]